VRARFIYCVDRERGQTSEIFLSLKQRIPSSREAKRRGQGTWPNEWTSDPLSFSLAESRERLAFSSLCPFFFSFTRLSRRDPHGVQEYPLARRVTILREYAIHPVVLLGTLLGLEFQRIGNLRAPHEKKHVILRVSPCRETDDYPGR